MNQIIQKFIIQEETQDSLKELETKYKTRLQELEAERDKLKEDIENLKANLDNEGPKKVIENIYGMYSQSRMELKSAQHKHQQVFNSMFGFKAGVLHLYNKLESVEPDLNVQGKVEEQSLKVLVKIVAQKLKIVNEFVKKNKKFAEMLQKLDN